VLQQIIGGLAAAVLPSLVALWFCYYVRMTSNKIAHMALIMLIASLFLPALKIQALEIPRLNNACGLFYGWQVLYLSFSPFIFTPLAMMSSVANMLFALNYIVLLFKSDKVFYFSQFNPVIAMAATTLSLFGGEKGFLDFDLRYQPENRIYIGAGTWICSHVLLAIAYSKFAVGNTRLHRLRFPSCGFLVLVGLVLIVDLMIWAQEGEKPEWQRVEFVAYSPGGNTLISSITNLKGSIYQLDVDQRIVIWDLQTKQVLHRFPLEYKWPTCYELSPKGDLLAYGIYEGPSAYGQSAKGIVVLMSTQTGKTQSKLMGHTGEILKISFSDDGSTIATASRDHSARIWRVSDGKELSRFENPYDVMSVALSPDGSELAYNTSTTVPSPNSSIVYVTDLYSAPQKRTLIGSAATNSMQVDFSHDSTRLACVGWDGVITTWKLDDISQPMSISSNVQRLTSLCFSPTNYTLAYGSYDKVAVLWDCEQGKAIAVLQHPVDVRSIAFSPDGKLLATGEGGVYDFEGAQAIRLWSVATGQLESTLDLSLAR
jgi:WD domain, G-beta repeat